MRVLNCLVIAFILIAESANVVAYVPWDELTQDSWIQFLGDDDPLIYPVNAVDNNDIAVSYPISFVQAATGNKARGMNALNFEHGGLTDGHLVSRDKAGTFRIMNTGDSNYFTDILLLIAIGAESLPQDFSMTINLAGQAPYVMDANDFVHYDNPYGRPSGFYSATDPNVEPISYAFNTAMVSVYGVSGLTSLDPLGGTIQLNYSFSRVPAPIVFSVYGYVSTGGEPSIYHTNRAFIDQNNKSKPVSTFAVTVDGDVNGDLKVDLADLAILSENWLTGMR